MRLDVTKLGAKGAGDGCDRPDLVDDRGKELGSRHVEIAPPETDQIRIAGMCPDGHSVIDREPDGPLDREWIARMRAARHVDAADQRDQPLVIAHRPWPEALADVGVQIDTHEPIVAP